jgi:hypothetical protein
MHPASVFIKKGEITHREDMTRYVLVEPKDRNTC